MRKEQKSSQLARSLGEETPLRVQASPGSLVKGTKQGNTPDSVTPEF